MPRRIGWIGLAVIVAALAVRLAWTAARTETGGDELQRQWRNATVGWFLGDYQPIAERHPVEQAEFWLAETERVLEQHPNDASLVMGAALMLDSPANQFHVARIEPHSLNVALNMPIAHADWHGAPTDNDSSKRIRLAKEQFEKRCRDRCLELAARATELELDNVELWRMRALLQFQEALHLEPEPRSDAWRKVLAQCAAHDPDNALYDYLAALFLWRQSAEMEYDTKRNASFLTITDADLYDTSLQHFERAQAKPILTVGDRSVILAARFLEHTSVYRVEHDELSVEHWLHQRLPSLMFYVSRWRDTAGETFEAELDMDSALAAWRGILRLVEQYDAQSPQRPDLIPPSFKVLALLHSRELGAEHPELASENKATALQEQVEAALLQQEVHKAAAQAIQRPQATFTDAEVAAAIATSQTPRLIVLLLVAHLICGWLGQRVSDAPAPPLSYFAIVAIWCLGVAAAFATFALAPAEVIARESFGMLVLATALFGGSIVLSMFLARFVLGVRRGEFRYSLRRMFFVFFVLSALLAILALLRPFLTAVFESPAMLVVPAQGADGLEAEAAKDLLPFTEFQWTLYQWSAWRGQYMALGGCLVLLALGCWLSARRRWSDDAAPRPSHAAVWSGMLKTWCRAAAVLLIAALLTYLAAAPSVLQMVEGQFQESMVFVRDPDTHWKKIEAALEDVRSDRQRMQMLKGAVEDELKMIDAIANQQS